MVKSLHSVLSRRERQIMDIILSPRAGDRGGGDGGAPGQHQLPRPCATQLRVLEEKGHVRHEEEGLRYVYMAAVPRHAARKSALRHLVETFFDGSAEKTVAALLGGEGSRLTDEESRADCPPDREDAQGHTGRIEMKASVIVLVALAATLGLRRRSAAVRHWILSAAIVCAAATPALELIVPSWHIAFGSSPVRPPQHAVRPGAASSPLVTAAAGRSDSSTPIGATETGTEAPPRRNQRPDGRLDRRLQRQHRCSRDRSRPAAPGSPRDRAGSRRVRGSRSRTRSSRRYGIRRTVRLLQSDHPSLLVTWGVLRPRILLPRGAAEWPDDRIRIVLSHELAHVDRGDWLDADDRGAASLGMLVQPLLWIAEPPPAR